MYTATFIENKLGYEEITYLIIDKIPVDKLEEALRLTKNGKILKLEHFKNDDMKLTKLYEFISPKELFLAIQKPNFLLSMEIIQFLVKNWMFIHKNNEAEMFYLNRVKKLLGVLL